MHSTAMLNGKHFFNTYTKLLPAGVVLDIGAQDVNGSLKELCPPHHNYIGVDFVEGKGVDVILTDPYKLPFEDNSADVIVSSSCFEHAEFFWLSYLEIMRVLKPSGLFYLSAPANGTFHRFPVDCWRFYPDSGNALAKWGRVSGYERNILLESYTSKQDIDPVDEFSRWNDFTAIFLKDGDYLANHPHRAGTWRPDIENIITHGEEAIANYQPLPQDLRK